MGVIASASIAAVVPVEQASSESPAVSVLVRSMARASLSRTLASVAVQTGVALEVVVINATGGVHPPLQPHCGPFPLRLMGADRPLSRPEAANLALAGARGRYVLFLDDDDTLDPDHLARLWVALSRQQHAIAAYAGVRLLNADGQLQRVLDQPFDSVQLLCENFLPIHAVLFTRSTEADAPVFDESLKVYEDWDYWLQLSQRGGFIHVPGVSASYYVEGDSGLSSQPDPAFTRAARLAVYQKWTRSISSSQLEAIANFAATHSTKVNELQTVCRQLQKQLLDLTLRDSAEQLRKQLLDLILSDSAGKQALHQALHRTQASLDQIAERVSELSESLQTAHEQTRSSQAQTQLAQTELHQLAARHVQVQHEFEAVQQARLSEVSDLQRQLHSSESARSGLQERASFLESRVHQVQSQLEQTTHGYKHLESGYLQVTNSLSWRLLSPLRRIRGALGRAFGEPSAAPSSIDSIGAPAASSQGSERLRAVFISALRHVPLSGERKQELKVWMVARPWAARWLPWFALSSSPTVLQSSAQTATTAASGSTQDREPGAKTVPAKLDKEAVRADAERQLSHFLQIAQRIEFKSHTTAPQLSVIVVLYNQAGLSLLCLQALAMSEGVSFELILVDNASTDRMQPLLERIDGATLLPQDSNLGFLRAVNLAALQARGEHLVLLNNDALVEPESLKLALDRLVLEPDAGAVGGPILLWDGSLQEAGSIIWQDGSCLGYGRGDNPDLPPYRFVRDVDYCSGAFMVVRRHLFEQLGGLDDSFAPAYYEETEFCARLWESGYRVVYDPAVRVRHFEFASEQSSGQALALQARNQQIFVAKHPKFLSQRPLAASANILRGRHRLAPDARRILVIDDRVPLPWLGQGYPRAARLIQEMVAAGHFVTHYPLQFPHEDPADVKRVLPQTVEVMVDQGLAGFSRFLAERAGLYDIVWVSRPHNMELLRAVTAQQPTSLQGAKLVYDAEALFSLRDIAKAEVMAQPFSAEEKQRRMAAELAIAQGVDTIITVTQQEALHYCQANFKDVHLVGHALEPNPTDATFEDRSGFLFVGASLTDDTPNADSLIWFVRAVWPAITRQLGSLAKLHVVGHCEAPGVLGLASDSVVLHGSVAELRPWFERCRAFVVPTRFAAGVAFKAHEAAAHGLPLVTTTLIAEQLGWQQVVDVGIDTEGFAAACIRLHSDPIHWANKRQAALEAVSRDCSPLAFAQAIRAVTGVAQPRSPATAVPLTPHQKRLAELSAMLRQQAHQVASEASDSERTADLWGRDAQARLSELHALRNWTSHPVTAREINLCVSDDPERGWIGHLKDCYFSRPGERGLSLGSGSGAAVIDCARLDIVAHMQGLDISPGAVEVARGRAIAEGLQHRVAFDVADLNSPVLQGPFDLVMFEQSLHHIDRLEEALDACASALRPGGHFVINEYIGPDRFQWSDDVNRLMNEWLLKLPPRYRIEPASGTVRNHVHRLTVEEVVAVDPSEAIHSSKILAACAARFELIEARDFGGTLLQFMLAEIIANFDPDEPDDVQILKQLVRAEADLIETHAIEQSFVFAVYRKAETVGGDPIDRLAPT